MVSSELVSNLAHRSTLNPLLSIGRTWHWLPASFMTNEGSYPLVVVHILLCCCQNVVGSSPLIVPHRLTRAMTRSLLWDLPPLLGSWLYANALDLTQTSFTYQEQWLTSRFQSESKGSICSTPDSSQTLGSSKPISTKTTRKIEFPMHERGQHIHIATLRNNSHTRFAKTPRPRKMDKTGQIVSLGDLTDQGTLNHYTIGLNQIISIHSRPLGYRNLCSPPI